MPDSDSPSRARTKQLGAWFLGPKAENASLEEEMILHILRDYFHWRRNYYPSDEIVITQRMLRESSDWHDALFQQLSEMLARLKRHFPFYSPRYIAHMLSDQTIPSVLGYFAGMLYNPNNVTPEAAPVTVEWELEVAADILGMLGYGKAPAREAHHRELRKEFGWAHITSGGTVANLEALWVARNVRYSPLAVREAARAAGVTLTVKRPGESRARPITELDDFACLSLKPNEAVFLLPRLMEALRHQGAPASDAAPRAWQLLAATGSSVAGNGTASVFARHPPVLFAAGTAHYSIVKAADVLGIGRENVVLVDVDRRFRLDVRDLDQKIRGVLDQGRMPLAVIAIAGTTEEGAVDPVHSIDALRAQLEAERHASFWLHADAAWTGYLRSMFAGPGEEERPPAVRIQELNRWASRKLDIRQGRYRRSVLMRWGDKEVCQSFLAFPRAESITVDPHKMGYVPYPCGVIAFRNDRIRHFLAQEAPYIGMAGPDSPASHVHQPPLNVGPFILEGSKPGAAAASCWLSHRMIPPDRSGYGEICRASLLAARELFERLVHWEAACRVNKVENAWRFVPITARPPDTNMVCFVIQVRGSRSLALMNRLAESVYGRFTIQAGPAGGDYAYSQPFFLSRTRFHAPQYSRHAVEDLLERAGADSADYAREGIFVLRATVMNPYIVLAAETAHKQAILAEFVEALAQITGEALAEIGTPGVPAPAEAV